MYGEELIKYVRIHAQPDSLDIEVARQIILDHLHIVSQSTFDTIGFNQLLSVVINQKQLFDKPITVENGMSLFWKTNLAMSEPSLRQEKPCFLYTLTVS